MLEIDLEVERQFQPGRAIASNKVDVRKENWPKMTGPMKRHSENKIKDPFQEGRDLLGTSTTRGHEYSEPEEKFNDVDCPKLLQPTDPTIAPLSAVSLNSSSFDQRVVEDFSIKIPIQRDGRILLPLRIIYGDLAWRVEALVDTGATVSIIAEHELERFSDLLMNEHGQVPPRGGFFRKIRIRKTNLNGPFQAKVASSYYKANLSILIKIGKARNLLTCHTVYVVKRMMGSLILGADFLKEYGTNVYYYLMDMAYVSMRSAKDMVADSSFKVDLIELPSAKSEQLINLDRNHKIADTTSVDNTMSSKELSVAACYKPMSTQQLEQLKKFMKKHELLLDGSLGLIRGYTHAIQMHDETPHKPRSFPIPLKYREVRQQITEMENLGVIRKEAEYINSLVVALRSNGKLRICLDARAINEKMANEHAQPPTIDEVLALIEDRKYFSKIDISRAYWQIALSEDSSKYTGFLFDGQTYIFKRLPFGLKTLSSAFTRALGKVIDKVPKLRPNLIVYLDDILVCSHSFEEHMRHLNELFDTLFEEGIRLNKDKCQFVTSTVKFLGHDLSQVSVEMAKDTKEAIDAFKTPRNKKQLQFFLGLINWDRRFIPNLSNLTRNLELLLQKDTKFKWTSQMESDFYDIKQAFQDAPKLFLLRPDMEYGLDTDASCVGLGARLYQFKGTDPATQYLLAYASRSLKSAELNYTTTEQEGLALAWALNKFRIILTGRTVHVSTDHRALTFLS